MSNDKIGIIEYMTTQQIVNYLFEKHNIQKIVNLVDKWGYTLSPNEPVFLDIPNGVKCSCGNCEECCNTLENECAN